MASSTESNADDAVDLKRVIEQAEKLAAQIDNGSIDTAQLQVCNLLDLTKQTEF